MTNALLNRCRLHSRAGTRMGSRATKAAVVAGLAVLMATAATASSARPAPRSFADLAEKVSPAVVNISVERRRSVAGFRLPQNSPFRDFYRRYFPNQPGNPRSQPRGFPRGFPRGVPRRNFRSRGLGSGFFVDAAGHVVTNYHVVRGASKIKVTMSNGKSYSAKLIGTDPKTDLALLKVTANEKFPHVGWGDSAKARVGDWVMAVGNPFGLGGTVTAGIISARGRNIGGRTIVDYLQVDAPINRGNSGGPTFDMDGNVIGVNTAIYSPNGGSVGLGFAIPSNTAKQVISQLKSRGKIDRGWLGVQIQPVTKQIASALGLPSADGAMVAMVVPGSPAAQAGFRAGDVIRKWNGAAVKNVRDLVRKVAQTIAGTPSKASVWRNRGEVELTVKVGDLSRARTASRQPARRGQSGNRAPTPSLDKVGIAVAPLTPGVRRSLRIAPGIQGVAIMSVRPGSAASRAKLRRGDVITRVGDMPVSSADGLRQAIEAARQAGSKAVLIMVHRNGRPQFVGLGLG